MNPAKYWSSLDTAWKKYLASEFEVDGPEKVKKLAREREVYLDETFSSTTLAPLEAFEKLVEFNCDAPKVKDLTPLATLARLEQLRISSKGLKDFSVLAELSTLKSVDVSGTGFSDLSVVAKLPLWYLNVSNTKVADLSALAGLKKLETLDLSGSKVTDLSPLSGLKKLSDLDVGGLKVASFAPLARVPLTRLSAAGSNLKDLAPFASHHLSSLNLMDTAVPFREVLAAQARVRETEGLVLSGHGEPKALLTELGRLDFPLEGLEATLTGFVHNAITAGLRQPAAEARALVLALLTKWLEQPASRVQHEFTEAFLANAVAAVARLEAPEPLVKATLALVPKEPTNKVLAFNLACHFAKRQDKPEALRLAKVALAAGQEAERFRQDADFGGLLGDPDFQALLGAPQLADPEADPEGWWDALPEDLRARVAIFDLSEEKGQRKADILRTIHRDDFALSVPYLDTLDHLRGLTGLTRLDLDDAKVLSLEPLRTLTGLETLKFSPAKRFQVLDWSPLSGCRALRTLTIYRATVDLAQLAAATKVTTLHLGYVKATSLEALGRMTQLTSLTLSLDDATVAGALVAPLTGLTQLNLQDLDALEPLSALTKLTRLGVSVKSATPVSLQPLSALTALTELDLGSTPFTDPAPLASLKALKRVRLNKNGPVAAVKKLLKAQLPKCEVNA